MIDKVATLCIFVTDQDRAKDFYINKLGFEMHDDQPMGPDSRWVSVAPKGAQTEVILYKMDQNWEHYKQIMGKSQALTFNVPDMNATYAELKAKGVQFTGEPDKQEWGTFATIVDPDDNKLLLVELPKK
jgi:lactoylglutathione lyase